MEISLDRLTVCGNTFGSIENFYKNSSEVKNRGFAKYPYRDLVNFVDGSVLQIAEIEAQRSGRVKQLRYEFNPNKSEFDKLHMQVIGLMQDVHCTRVDIAFDVRDIDMSRWKWIDSKSRPYNVYYSGNGQVETWYVGGKDSEVKIRIYDKAKERKLSEGVWWRVEVQLRGEPAKLSPFLGGQVFNPFENVTPVVNGHFPELDIKRRAMVNYLIENPSGFSELANQARSEYKKLLRLVSSWECINFHKIWDEKSSFVGNEVKGWLDLAKEL